jgi:lipopolysaccharide transport system ATP-binding protein
MLAVETKNLGVSFMLQQRKKNTLLETLIRNLWPNGRTKKTPTPGKETFWPLRDISFSIEQGESFGVIGRNGAGKSTLLQILSGIYKPDEGSVKVNGTVGLLQIGTGFHEDLTGSENIYLNGAIMGLKKKEIDELYDSIVEFSEIERFIDTPMKKYSSGMRSRLGFSIAINIQPDILLIDEVLAVGDQSFKEKCKKELEKIRGKDNTVVLVSHALPEVKSMCERAICLDKGKVIFEGASSDAVEFYSKFIKSSKGNKKAKK